MPGATAYETLIYEQDDHVVTLTLNRPEQHNAINRHMNRSCITRGSGSGTTTTRSCWCSPAPAKRRSRAGWDLADAAALPSCPTTRSSARSIYNAPGRVRLHAPGRRVQAGDRGRQRLRVRGRPRDGTAGRHPDRVRERRVRRARAALEHRRRRRDDGPAAAGRRLRARDGAADHRPPGRGPTRPSESGW